MSTNQKHSPDLSALVSQTSFQGETFGGFAKCRLFSLVEPGHLEEEYSITTFFADKRFSSFFANGPIKFNVPQCNRGKL